MLRFALGLVALTYAMPVAAQRADVDSLRGLLRASVRVEVTDKRFSAVVIDTVADTLWGARFVNRNQRLFSYLVEHQLRPEELFRGVAQAEQPTDAMLSNLFRDAAAVSRLGEYVSAGSAARATRRPVSEARVASLGARFYHPLIQPNGKVVFYRCAGINGISALGSQRDPTLEAFAFWAIGPTVFDADTATTSAKALNARFATAAAAFRARVANATSDTALVAQAREQFYGELAGSPELRQVLRSAYLRDTTAHPFAVPEWNRSRAR